VLVGRERELRRLTSLLDEARRGRSGTLVVVGEAGLGKTALLQEACSQAPEMRVLAATGVESEAELPYSSLHELLRGVLDLLPRIPASQSRALAAALALEAGHPDALAVGAGTLSLLVEATADAPVLVALDDAHWLDRASADAIVFATRRLIGENLALLATVRPGVATPFDLLPRLELGPLADDDARRLLRQRTVPVAARDETRLLGAAAGNPLALLELPVELTGDLPTSATPHERLRRAFSQRVEELPEPGRVGLLLAAAEPDLGAVRRAAEQLGLENPLAAAEAARLVRVEAGEISFRHPVVRSLVYASAAPAQQRAAHRALAEALSEDEDRDRRAWHRAAMVDGLDEEVAAALEDTASHAAARGGIAAQAQALERSARLSPAPAARARRLLAAAAAFRRAGDSERALELAGEALPQAEDRLVHADLVYLAGSIRRQQDAGLSDVVLVRESEVDGLDAERIAKLLSLALDARLYALDAAAAVALAPKVETAAREADWPFGLTFVASAYLLAGERERATALGRELAHNPDVVSLSPLDFLWLEWYDELGLALAEGLRTARASGNQVRVAYTLAASAHVELRLGRLAHAAAAAAEAIPLAEAIGTSGIAGIASAALAHVHAWRGQADAARSQAGAALTAARMTGDSYHDGVAGHALALLSLGTGGAGGADDAIVELLPFAQRWAGSTVVEPGVAQFVPDLIEALVVSGARDEAREWLARFSAAAAAADRLWALAACARCEGMLAAPDDVDEPFSRALELHARSPLALERARTHLAYGERLRRQRRRRDARIQLRSAYEAFAAVSASPWQARAVAELQAAGEQVSVEARPLPELTPQELHIARLIAEGKANKEIAAALFLSPKTIEYHLANAFRKLNIHSRAELAAIVARDAGAP
jgi:DNA-binding CsgD family transcriptional regulator